MAVTVRIEGSAELKRVAAQIKAQGGKGLGREMSAGLRKASRPVQDSVRREFAAALPSRGGYRATASKSQRFRTSVKSGARTGFVQLTTFAEGTSQRREIRALNAGVLRHPVYGRSRNTRTGRRPNPWAVTRIRSGFFDRGTDEARPLAEAAMRDVLDDFARRLAKG